MNATTAFRVSAITGMLAVVLGAFGAHGLEAFFKSLPPEEGAKHLDWWKTAVAYHLPHAVVLLVLAQAAQFRVWAWRLILGGIVLFSGSLYTMAVGGPRWLGMIVTPLGGTLMIAGWLVMAFEKPPKNSI